MRLHVDMFGTEKFPGAVDRQLLGNIDEFAAAVIPLGGITFGILVGQDRPLGLQDSFTDKILGSDKFETVLLPLGLFCNCFRNFRIKIGKGLRHGCSSSRHSPETKRQASSPPLC